VAARPAPAEQRAAATALTVDEQATVDRALTTGVLPTSRVLATLHQETGALMSAGEGTGASATDFVPRTPKGLVDTARPTLTWSALDSGTRPVSYRVDIYDGTYDRVARSGWLTETSWTPERPLAAGRMYVWQVTARSGGRDVTVPAPPQPEARFMTATAAQHAELAAMRQRAGDAHIALAVLLAQAGVIDEAEHELSLARAADPGSAAVTRLQESIERRH
jgi:hypothetical protein